MKMSFGKYIGKDIEHCDASYLLWLFSQDWLKSKYPDVYKYIKENKQALEEEIEDPEHDY